MDFNIDKLTSKYPQLFSEEGLVHGVECSDGWAQLIDDVLACIQSHEKSLTDYYQYKIQHGDPQQQAEFTQKLADMQPTKFAQIKSKFASLRMYYDGGDAYTAGVTSLAERLSERTCERCGDPGVVRTKGWWRTLCDEHHVIKIQ